MECNEAQHQKSICKHYGESVWRENEGRCGKRRNICSLFREHRHVTLWLCYRRLFHHTFGARVHALGALNSHWGRGHEMHVLEAVIVVLHQWYTVSGVACNHITWVDKLCSLDMYRIASFERSLLQLLFLNLAVYLDYIWLLISLVLLRLVDGFSSHIIKKFDSLGNLLILM